MIDFDILSAIGVLTIPIIVFVWLGHDKSNNKNNVSTFEKQHKSDVNVSSDRVEMNPKNVKPITINQSCRNLAIEKTLEYRKILNAINSGEKVIFVTGSAGTGKTTLIEYLKIKAKKKSVVVAPTGVAALNIKGSTIHSFFLFPPCHIKKTDIKKMKNSQLYKKMELLIIDEVSMVNPNLIDSIDLFLKKNRNSNELFGGVQILFCGDLFQLPPVIDQDLKDAYSERYNSEFFYGAKSLRNVDMLHVELTKNFRQEKDKEFAGILNKIRMGENVKTSLNVINSRANFNESTLPKDIIALTCTNKVAESINQKRLNEIKENKFIFEGEVEGKWFGKNIHETNLPVPYELVLKKESRVMFTKNDPEKRWVNGSLGIVKSINNQEIQVEIDNGYITRTFPVYREKWERYKYEYDYEEKKITQKVIGKYFQYPLRLAWAITTHKSQGKTLPNVYLYLDNTQFCEGLVYVGLSRVREMENIFLHKKLEEIDIKSKFEIKDYYDKSFNQI